MLFRITAGLYFLLIGLTVAGLHVGPVVLSILALIAGIALLLGL